MLSLEICFVFSLVLGGDEKKNNAYIASKVRI